MVREIAEMHLIIYQLILDGKKKKVVINIILFIVFQFLYMMMPYFNQNWAGACGGRWVGPRLLMG